MAEDPNSPLNQALVGLGTTINTITHKVEAGKTRVREYKAQIVTKLQEVVEQLNSLKANNNLKAVPQLRKQLQDSQSALQEKTEELDKTKSQLNEANKTVQQLQQNIDQINREIEEKNQQITDLTNLGKQKDKAIQDLDAQVRELDKQKEEAEKNLLSAQQQIDSIIQKIGQLNTALVNQIKLIDTIANELGDLDNGDVAKQFKAVTDNIKIIVDMLTNSGEGQSAPVPEAAEVQQQLYDVEENFNKLINLHLNKDNGQYQRFVQRLDGQIQNKIAQVINSVVDRNDPQAIATLKQILEQKKLEVPTIINGGKSRRHKRRGGRKTMKKRHRRTHKKMRGGYVYNTSKELDRASSVISNSSSSRSSSISKSKSNKKHKTRNYRMHK